MEQEPPSDSHAHVLPVVFRWTYGFLQETQYHTKSYNGNIQYVWVSRSHQMRNQEDIGPRVSEIVPCDYTVEEHGCQKMARKNLCW
jgi:hypothetical protein